MSADLILVRSERVGEVHAIRGATVRSKGRDLSGTACNCVIAGPPFFGTLEDLTCDECLTALTSGVIEGSEATRDG